MALDMVVQGVAVKRRGPLVTWLLILVTLGIYGLFHWYYMNREVRDFSAAAGAPIGNSPGKSVLAIFPGFILIVPVIWTWVTTATRVREVRRIVLAGSVCAVQLPLQPSAPLPAGIAQFHLGHGRRNLRGGCSCATAARRLRTDRITRRCALPRASSV